MLTVAGAGMAGLCAAARARELGVAVVVHEKGDRPGGSMLLSSCVVWRHRDFDGFRAECPRGDERLQRRVYDDLDDALDWLESLGAPVTARSTGNVLTVGRRFDPRGLTAALMRAAGAGVEVERPFAPDAAPLVLATGGFAARLARERGLALRANPWSEGDALEYALARGAALTTGMDEFYGRAIPYPLAPDFGEDDYVAAAQLYGRRAHVVDDDGVAFFDGEPSWSENDLVQAIAHRPGGRAWYVVDAQGSEQRVRDRGVREMVAYAERVGGEVRRADRAADLRLGPLESPKLLEPPFVAVHVQAAVTHTIGGVRVDERARVLRDDGIPIAALYAAGVDAGGIANGGYASGLAAALVFGRIAAETAAAEAE